MNRNAKIPAQADVVLSEKKHSREHSRDGFGDGDRKEQRPPAGDQDCQHQRSIGNEMNCGEREEEAEQDSSLLHADQSHVAAIMA